MLNTNSTVVKELNIVVKTLFGLEDALLEELNELGFSDAKILNRAVELQGDWEDVYRLNYRCRLAISVLVKITEFEMRTEDDLYKKSKKIDWTQYFDVKKTFAVKGAVFSDMFKHSQFPMLLVKDAIADVFRDKFEERPNVNIKSPQVMIDVHISNKTVILSLNTSGVPLYQRGYRQVTGEAPLNEVLAAGLIRLSGWDRKSTFIDPMCGSGTLVIEAALLAANIPSMIEREHYAFKNFSSFNEEIWEKVKAEGNTRPIKLDFDIIGMDNDAGALQKARRNARSAPIGNMVTFEVGEMKDLKVDASNGTLICNPPYGERIGEDIVDLYKMMGDVFKNELAGFQCWVISSNVDALKHLGLRPERRIKLFNGSLECSFRRFSIYEGTKRVRMEELEDEERIEQREQMERDDKQPRQEETPRNFDKPRNYDRQSREDKPRRESTPRREEKPWREDKPRREEKKRDAFEKPAEINEPRPTKYDSTSTFKKPVFGKSDGKYKTVTAESEDAPTKVNQEEKTDEKIPAVPKEVAPEAPKEVSELREEKPKSKYAPRIESTKDKIERMKKGRG